MVINERGSIMYINRKDGTLVEARFKYNIGFWKIYKSGNLVKELEDKDFREQYGEAVICPKKFSDSDMKKCNYCPLTKPHICQAERNTDKDFDCPACIPYIPEEYDVDNEPTFPICGTCNYIKDKNLEQSNLMLSDVEKQKYIHKSKVSYGDITVDEEIVDVDGLLKAELDHLKGLGIVYVRVEIECPQCRGEGYECWLDEGGNHQGRTCVYCKSDKKIIKYIPLSDYKGEK